MVPILIIPLDNKPIHQPLTHRLTIPKTQRPNLDNRFRFNLTNFPKILQIPIILIHNRSKLMVHNLEYHRIHRRKYIFFHIDGIFDGLFDFLFYCCAGLAWFGVLGFYLFDHATFVLVYYLVELGVKLLDFLELAFELGLAGWHCVAEG